MKMYSDDVVSKAALDEVDQKQTKQITQLRILVGGVFCFNLLTLAAYHYFMHM